MLLEELCCLINRINWEWLKKNSDQGGNWTHDLRVRTPLLYRLSYKVRSEQAVGTDEVKVTAMNTYKYKEGQSNSLPVVSDVDFSFLNNCDWVFYIFIYIINIYIHFIHFSYTLFLSFFFVNCSLSLLFYFNTISLTRSKTRSFAIWY